MRRPARGWNWNCWRTSTATAYAEGLFDPDQMKAFHELYVDLLERMIRQEDVWKDS